MSDKLKEDPGFLYLPVSVTPRVSLSPAERGVRPCFLHDSILPRRRDLPISTQETTSDPTLSPSSSPPLSACSAPSVVKVFVLQGEERGSRMAGINPAATEKGSEQRLDNGVSVAA